MYYNYMNMLHNRCNTSGKEFAEHLSSMLRGQAASNLSMLTGQALSNLGSMLTGQAPSNLSSMLTGQAPNNLGSKLTGQALSNLGSMLTGQAPSNLSSMLTGQAPSNLCVAVVENPCIEQSQVAAETPLYTRWLQSPNFATELMLKRRKKT